MKVQLDDTMFWGMYNALRIAESVLWECNGATNPEDENLTNDIVEANDDIATILDKLQPIITKIKDNECDPFDKDGIED